MMRSLFLPCFAVICMCFASAKPQAQTTEAAFPGNEAVRVAHGKRVVEAPPLTEATKRFLKGGNKLPPPTPGDVVHMVEGPQSLVECSSGALTETGCTASTLGRVKLMRYWTVKLAGTWVHCNARSQPRVCEAAAAGAPSSIPLVE